MPIRRTKIEVLVAGDLLLGIEPDQRTALLPLGVPVRVMTTIVVGGDHERRRLDPRHLSPPHTQSQFRFGEQFNVAFATITTDPLDRPAVVAEVARWLSDVSGDDTTATILDVRKPDASGFSHNVTFVTARFDAHGRSVVRDLVLRRDPDDLALFVDADLGREAELMQRVHRLGTLPVPEVIGFNADDTILGTPYVVMAKVPGAVASDNPSYNASGWLADALPTQRRAAWEQALLLMSRVTTVDAGAFDDLFPERHAEFVYWHRNILWATDGSPSPTIDAAWHHLSASVPPDTPAALSWGDARIGNIIFDGGTPAAIIDWEMASLGGSHLDLGWWLMTDLVHSTQMGCTRLDGLGTRSETIQAWCAATGLQADAIEWHEAFAALKLGVAIGRVTNVAHRRGLLPPDLLAMADDNFGTRILAQLLPVPPPGQPASAIAPCDHAGDGRLAPWH